jgi:hypothetical protein
MAKRKKISGFGNLALDVGQEGAANAGGDAANVLDFIEKPWGLGFKLFPVQRVILKAYYGIPLSEYNKFEITDFRRENTKRITEADYLRMLHDEGRCNIREVVEGQERQEMILSIGRRSGKCVVGDTLVLTDKGLFPIEDLKQFCDLENPTLVDDGVAYPLDIGISLGGGKKGRTAYFYDGGIRKTFKVTTSGGLCLEGTANHRILCKNSHSPETYWKRLDEIGSSDLVAISHDFFSESERLYEFSKKEFLTKEEAHTYRIRRLNAGAVTSLSQNCQGIYEVSDTTLYGSKGFHYEYVQSVVESESHVYDLNVPDGSRFVANGFVNHNTTISACISGYETYRLLKKVCPQDYYGLPLSNQIQLISIATDKDQAGLLFNEVSGHFKNCKFFLPYTANQTQSYVRFQTPFDVEKYGKFSDNERANASIRVTFKSCIAKGLRGAGNIVVILDEAAHFTSTGQTSLDDVYNAVTPSTSAFTQKDPNDRAEPIGDAESKIILISSPLGRQGLFYKLFSQGMEAGADSQFLCVQAPTWEVNPTFPASEFVKNFKKNATVFFTEYGGVFSDKTLSWLDNNRQDVLQCIAPNRKPTTQVPPRRAHFLGLDIGLKQDGTAAAVGHIENGVIVLDAIEYIKAGEGKYADQERLDLEGDVVPWLKGIAKRFFIREGIFDQYSGIVVEQAIHRGGLKQIQMVNHTKPLNSLMFKNFETMLAEKKIELYDYPVPEGQDHCDYIEELFSLQAEVLSKHMISVEAPPGKHDDRSDALVRMIWLASQQLGTQTSISGVTRERGGTGQKTFAKAPRPTTRKGQGSHSSRTRPSLRGGRRRRRRG